MPKKWDTLELPLVLPFTAQGLTFSDLRGLPVEESASVRRLGANNLVDIVRGVQRTTPMCLNASNLADSRMEEDLRVRLKEFPGTDIKGFYEAYIPEFIDSECDPRLTEIVFKVEEGGETIGAWIIYNGTLRGVKSPRISVSGYPAPGITFDEQLADRIKRGLRAFLEVEMEVMLPDLDNPEINQTIMLRGWEFPTEDAGHNWESPQFSGIFDELSGDFDLERKNGRVRGLSRRFIVGGFDKVPEAPGPPGGPQRPGRPAK